ncbi:MAG: hypothetical protein KKB50_04185 [Planctomycetes bacterium]|nr:hypothetical protein [Planctomycetota bacterium]
MAKKRPGNVRGPRLLPAVERYWDRFYEKGLTMRYIMAVCALLMLTGCTAGRTSTTTTDAPSPDDQPTVSVRVSAASREPEPGFVEVADDDGCRLYVDTDALLTERDVVSAKCEKNRFGRFTVVLKLDDDGADRLYDFTGRHLGGWLAIFVDDELVSAPSIRSRVSHSVVITGNLTQRRAEQIAAAIGGK